MNKTLLVLLICFPIGLFIGCSKSNPTSAQQNTGNSSTNHAPAMLFSPSPANNEVGVLTQPTISWSCYDQDQGDTVEYKVILGYTAQPDTYYAHQAMAFVPNPLLTNTLYSWQVLATDNHGLCTAGPIWKFTTGTR